MLKMFSGLIYQESKTIKIFILVVIYKIKKDELRVIILKVFFYLTKIFFLSHMTKKHFLIFPDWNPIALHL